MRFDSVWGIKQRLCEGCGEVGGLTFKTAAAVSEPRRLGVALGVAVGRGAQDFRLALRITRATPSAAQFANNLSTRLHGEIDVQRVGVIRAPRPLAAAYSSGYEQEVRPLLPGFSVGHHQSTAGTIGAFVREADGTYCILSNNHVLANSNRARAGDQILQPGPADGGMMPWSAAARLRRFQMLEDGATMDAAIARTDVGVRLEPRYAGRLIHQDVAQVAPRARVWKIGRSTGLTNGLVRAVGMDDVPVNYDGRITYLDDQIEIEGDVGPFSWGGDSGSLVIDADLNPVGLLFAGSEEGGALGHGVTYANPLGPVLDAFGVTLYV